MYIEITILHILIKPFESGINFEHEIMCKSALKPGRVIRVIQVTFSPGHPGLTRIGSREKRNCSFEDVELINAIA